jgi:hypothetical protein
MATAMLVEMECFITVSFETDEPQKFVGEALLGYRECGTGVTIDPIYLTIDCSTQIGLIEISLSCRPRIVFSAPLQSIDRI